MEDRRKHDAPKWLAWMLLALLITFLVLVAHKAKEYIEQPSAQVPERCRRLERYMFVMTDEKVPGAFQEWEYVPYNSQRESRALVRLTGNVPVYLYCSQMRWYAHDER